MREITLSQGMVALVVDEDFDLVSQFKWHAYKDHNAFYAQAHDTPATTIYMHRILLGVGRGCRDVKVDHRDGNGLNNQRYNLRLATHAQNMQNRRKVAGKHRYKGVTPTATPGMWRARIRVDQKELHLGSFYSEEFAASAYDNKARGGLR